MSETITKTAKRLHKVAGMLGDAAVYELTPPYTYEDGWGDNRHEVTLTHVVVSAVDLPDISAYGGGDYRKSETMIFASDGTKVSDYGDLAMVPHKSHADALEVLGYEVA